MERAEADHKHYKHWNDGTKEDGRPPSRWRNVLRLNLKRLNEPEPIFRLQASSN